MSEEMMQESEVKPAPSLSQRLATTTSAKAWRKQATDGELYQLPGSGNVARLKTVSLMALAAKAGTIPNKLSQTVLRFLGTGDNPKNEAERIKLYQDNSRAFIECAALAMVEPRIIIDRDPNYEAGEIAPADMHDQDVLWIYYTFLGGTAEARAEFRIVSEPVDPERAAVG